MTKNPLNSTLTTLQGNIISLSPEFYFQVLDHPENELELLHLGENGKLITHTLDNLPYKLVFTWRSESDDHGLEINSIKHIIEYIPSIINQLPSKFITNICLFLIADRAIVFIMRLQEILYVKLHRYTNADDLLFHLMNGLKINELDPDQIQLTICGDIAMDSVIMNHLSSYFIKVSCLPLSIEKL